MQDNEPLMRALSKVTNHSDHLSLSLFLIDLSNQLVKLNHPDKVIFVGEALVGNEAVDQLVKFNQALKSFTDVQKPRHIDGILLTKFDTIDDKVGAAISMAYATGQPILFVGTGQTYTDLKKLNIKTVVDALLKS
jgi:signal recognition particle receptor subunit alpha